MIWQEPLPPATAELASVIVTGAPFTVPVNVPTAVNAPLITWKFVMLKVPTTGTVTPFWSGRRGVRRWCDDYCERRDGDDEQGDKSHFVTQRCAWCSRVETGSAWRQGARQPPPCAGAARAIGRRPLLRSSWQTDQREPRWVQVWRRWVISVRCPWIASDFVEEREDVAGTAGGCGKAVGQVVVVVGLGEGMGAAEFLGGLLQERQRASGVT